MESGVGFQRECHPAGEVRDCGAGGLSLRRADARTDGVPNPHPVAAGRLTVGRSFLYI